MPKLWNRNGCRKNAKRVIAVTSLVITLLTGVSAVTVG